MTQNRTIHLFLFIFLFNLSLIFARQTDYLIVENPAALLILNKYEQNSAIDFPSFTPFRIIEEHTLLSDAVTPALKAEAEGKPLFIVRDEKEKFIGEEGSGYAAIFRKCASLGDSVRVLRERSIWLYEKYFNQRDNRREYLKKEDILIRIFKYKGSYYVKRINRSPAYGWCRLPAGTSWSKLEPQRAGRPVLSEDLRLRIRAFIAGVNLTYKNYFDYFNGAYQDHIPAPRWEVRDTDRGLEMRLSGLEAKNLPRSNEVLIRNLETLLLGSGFGIYPKEGILQILPRSGRTR